MDIKLTCLIVLIITVIICMILIYNRRQITEKFSVSSEEALQNIASLYNQALLTVTNLTSTGTATTNTLNSTGITTGNLTVNNGANINTLQTNTLQANNSATLNGPTLNGATLNGATTTGGNVTINGTLYVKNGIKLGPWNIIGNDNGLFFFNDNMAVLWEIDSNGTTTTINQANQCPACFPPKL